MTSTITAQEHRRQNDSRARARLDQDPVRVANDARNVLAARCSDAAELRRIGEMLGLFATDPANGAIVEADPWAEKPGFTTDG